MNYLIGEFKKTEGIDLSKDQTAMQRVKEEAEKGQKRTFIFYDSTGKPSIYRCRQ